VPSWRTHARWGAIAWGVVAAFEAVVAYLSQAFPPFDLSVVFAVSALVSLLATVLMTRVPSTRVLLAATAWAVLNLVLGLWAMPVGAQDLTIPFALLVGAAGLVSVLAWRGRRDQA
jgi:hypothetical protein